MDDYLSFAPLSLFGNNILNPLNNYPFSNSVDNQPSLSVLVPIYNEADNIARLIGEIRAALDGKIIYELIYVDDGSTDASWQKLQQIGEHLKNLRIIRHKCSYGQSIAVLTGVKLARAEWVVTLDGDGQNDPADIPRLLAILQNRASEPQLQMVAGLRHHRQDNWLKRISSRIANWIRSRLLHDNTPDTGCSLKLFSRTAFLALPHFNHIHRFLPALFLRNGGQVISIEVNHRPRWGGKSKYGIFDRFGTGIIDLLGVMWLQRRAVNAEIIEDNQKHDN
jgi:dolichol-phosphate mannosyltransferase